MRARIVNANSRYRAARNPLSTPCHRYTQRDRIRGFVSLCSPIERSLRVRHANVRSFADGARRGNAGDSATAGGSAAENRPHPGREDAPPMPIAGTI